MINNFEQIRTLLNFPTEHSFYFLQILKRRKENPEMEKHVQLIDNFYIYSFEEFDKRQERIIELCNLNNARAYFRLNLREADKLALQVNKRTAELLLNGNYKGLSNIYPAVTGEFHQDTNKKWLIDLDFDDITIEYGDFNYQFNSYKDNIISKIHDCGGGIVAAIPTANGKHLITTPFRMDTFRESTKNLPKSIDVHKDNPTILYQP